MLESAKARAQRCGVPFGLSLSDITVPKRCPVLGLVLMRRNGSAGPGDSSPTLDRIIPKKGYTPGNVIVVSWRANRLKSDATADELRRIADFYNG